MRRRSGEGVEGRLRQCPLYDPTLDLAVEAADGRPKVGYGTDVARALYVGAGFRVTSTDRSHTRTRSAAS